MTSSKSNALLPSRENYLSSSPSGTKAAPNTTDSSLMFLLTVFFREIIALEGKLETAKKELAVRSDFTLAGAFNFFTGYN